MMMTETATPRSPRDWPTLLGDNARTGGQGQVKLLFPEKAAWQYRAGSAVRSAPVLRDGILYVASVSGVLHAIDVGTGTSKWKFQSAGQVHSTPSLFENVILFGCDDGNVYALDRRSGKKLWEAASQAEVWSSAVVRDGVVFFGSADGRVYAVDAGGGHEKWSTEPWWKDLFHALCRRASALRGMRRRQCPLSRSRFRKDIVGNAYGQWY